MNDAVIGLLAVAVGALFCFRGYLAMRIIAAVKERRSWNAARS